MINRAELLFVVDENNEPLEPLPRNEVHQKNLWHRCSQIIVINSQKQILCQKRSALKDNHPNMWEANFGGHLGPDDSFLENALRETKEELGLDKKAADMHFFEVYKSVKEYEFQGIYYLIWNGNELTLEKEEVDKVIWENMSELKKFYQNNNSMWVQHGYELRLLTFLTTLTFKLI